MSSTAPARPLVVALDVNETLSDMSGLDIRFAQIGAPPHLRTAWFAAVLRDGFGLTAAGARAEFAVIARTELHLLLGDVKGLTVDPAEAAEIVLTGLAELQLHADVRPGLERMRGAGIRLVTLTNGSVETTRALLERGNSAELMEQLLSVESVGRWKPAPEPYSYAAGRCGVRPEQMMLAAVHPWDVDGAGRAGLTTAWINRSRGPYPECFRRANLECRDFMELAEALVAGQARRAAARTARSRARGV
ncbi:MAG: haloacid dehalogenase type II [Solirubrobacteraceae bacterium]